MNPLNKNSSANGVNTETVNAKIRVGGDINIYGNPQTVNEDTALGGRVRRM